MNRRLEVLKHWCFGKKNGVSLKDLARFLMSPGYSSKASAKINSIDETREYLVMHFKDVKEPLYCPKDVNKAKLFQIVGEMMYPKDWHYYEIDQTRVSPQDIVLDCGAAEGLFSLLIANRCKKVYAIEPLNSFVKAMKVTFSGFNNIEIIPVALSDRELKGSLLENGISSHVIAGGEGVPVEITTIDRLFHDKDRPVSYIKADLEGCEMEMLKGARKTIGKYKPKIVITTYHDKDHADMISRYLKSINSDYKILLKGIKGKLGLYVMLHAW